MQPIAAPARAAGVTFEVRDDGLDIDLDLGLAGAEDGVAERRDRFRVALRSRCQAVPGPLAVIAVVADDVVAGISERPHRSLGAIIEPRAVVEEQDHWKRTIALGVHDVDPHVPVPRRHCQFPVHDLTLRSASWALSTQRRIGSTAGDPVCPLRDTLVCPLRQIWVTDHPDVDRRRFRRLSAVVALMEPGLVVAGRTRGVARAVSARYGGGPSHAGRYGRHIDDAPLAY